jgi:hypothetical protein
MRFLLKFRSRCHLASRLRAVASPQGARASSLHRNKLRALRFAGCYLLGDRLHIYAHLELVVAAAYSDAAYRTDVTVIAAPG